MSVTFALVISDGSRMRAIQPAALPHDIAQAIWAHIAADLIEPSGHPAVAPPEAARPRAVSLVPPARSIITDQVAPAAPVPNRDRVAASEAAKAEGLSGMFCARCSSARTKQNGTCLICLDCHETTGCS